MTARMRTWTGPDIFVLATWIALFSGAIYYVHHFGAAEPFGDEWDLIPGLTYQEPYLNWLWTQHNEHRLPLPKLLYTWLLNLSGFDARVGGMATVAVLGTLSLAFVLTARRMRGRTEYADAFFPIAFLNWGHFENYLIGFQISFALTVGLSCLWLLAMIEKWSLRWQLLPLALLPLCGAHGIVFTIPLGMATIWLNRKTPAATRITSVGIVAISWILTALYFRNYASPATHPHSAGVLPSAKIATEVLALSWGWVGQMTWPVSGLLIVSLLTATVVLALAVASRHAGIRDALIPYVGITVGVVGLAGGIGWGRSGFGPLAGFAVRYGIFMLPMMAAIYLVWLQVGGRLGASLVPMTLFTIACLFLTQHFRTGLSEGRLYAAQMSAFAEDLRAGHSPADLANRHTKVYPQPDVFAERIRQLRASGLRRYALPTATAQR